MSYYIFMCIMIYHNIFKRTITLDKEDGKSYILNCRHNVATGRVK